MANFLLIATFEAVFIGLLILAKRKKSTSDYILFSLFVVYAITIGFSFLEIYNRNNSYPYPIFISVSVPFIFLHGPLLWYYVLSLTKQKFTFRINHLFHLLPFLSMEIMFWFTSYRLPVVDRIAMDSGATFQQEVFYPVLLILIALSTLVYYSLGLRRIQCHSAKIKSYFAEIGAINLKWIKMFLILALICHLSISVLYIVDYSLGLMAYNSLQLSGFVMASIYTLVASTRKTEPLTTVEEQFVERFLAYMQNEKPFLNNELTLALLAKGLDVSPEYLSSVLNGRLNSNFFDFINRYRVEEFKRICHLPENKQYTIIALAYDCGFNSKATFNRVFRQHTGTTPGAYIKK
jgi:AraC-like DNA-binding protein